MNQFLRPFVCVFVCVILLTMQIICQSPYFCPQIVINLHISSILILGCCYIIAFFVAVAVAVAEGLFGFGVSIYIHQGPV